MARMEKRHWKRLAAAGLSLLLLRVAYDAILFFSPLIISTMLCVLSFRRLGLLLEECRPQLVENPEESQGSGSGRDTGRLEKSGGLEKSYRHFQKLAVRPVIVEEVVVKERQEGRDSGEDEETMVVQAGRDSSGDEVEQAVQSSSDEEDDVTSAMDDSDFGRNSSSSSEIDRYMSLFVEESDDPEVVEERASCSDGVDGQESIPRAVFLPARRKHFLSDVLFLPALFRVTRRLLMRAFFATF
ncbi:hypothetical protein SELMODRAFT_443669 [Selaginella moellendorffii]|uniref:Uncharacterized protein n=1 Tax=Selaginella moellendorffii TaxID=88036 RepID=D8S3D2_SELML|nr:hypothetical protein SELMODRAFT_443669 [Selaginella moellendorffii]